MPTCIHCNGTLEPGYLLDRDGRYRPRQQRWVAGVVDDSVLGALFQRSAMQNIGDTLPVTTYRCTTCGWLDSFARPAD
ncbi:hypothetical protein [Thermomonas sp.]|uniref:hypothetical protein n=1 Tax=Thermomonas sp. TaxID=1971895 RepID=UPI002626718E|nr:hypothetical protein [Thermomonas sp.]